MGGVVIDRLLLPVKRITKEENMKLRILRSATLPGVGSFKPGTVVIIPNDVAEGWLRSGVARVEDGTPWVPGAEPKLKPRVKPRPKPKKAKSGPTARQIRERAEAQPKAKPKTKIEPDPVLVSESIVASESESE